MGFCSGVSEAEACSTSSVDASESRSEKVSVSGSVPCDASVDVSVIEIGPVSVHMCCVNRAAGA